MKPTENMTPIMRTELLLCIEPLHEDGGLPMQAENGGSRACWLATAYDEHAHADEDGAKLKKCMYEFATRADPSRFLR